MQKAQPGARRSLPLCIVLSVFLPVTQVKRRFGAKHLGTNARQLRQKVALGEPLPRYEQMQQSVTSDPILRAIYSTIDTMENGT